MASIKKSKLLDYAASKRKQTIQVENDFSVVLQRTISER